MKPSVFRFYFLSVVIVLAACRESVPPKVYDVPAELQHYVDLFEQEAAKRGQDVTVDNLRVLYEGDLVNGTAAGTCTYPHTDDPIPTVRFDTTSVNWSNNEYSREILFFHELGHCVLQRREHRDDLLPNGNFTSIMRSTGAQVYGGPLNNFKRDYYLDELFDPTTPAPDWAKDIPAYEAPDGNTMEGIFIEEFLNNIKGWNEGTSANSVSDVNNGVFNFQSKNETTAYFTLNNAPNLGAEIDFVLEANLRIVEGENSVMVQWGGKQNGDGLHYLGITPDKNAFVGNWSDGIAMAREVPSMVPSEFNKLTIRKSGDFYYLYVNEEFFDVLQSNTLEGTYIGFYVGPKTFLQVDWIRIYKL